MMLPEKKSDGENGPTDRQYYQADEKEYSVKLKLDLHPIFNDARKIEDALKAVIEEAVEKRASEVEIIPGKGSGALKKGVLRFLERPEIKSQYHRVEKDGDNWGRLFVHFRHDRQEVKTKAEPEEQVEFACACCRETVTVSIPDLEAAGLRMDCPWCGSPNSVKVYRDRKSAAFARAVLDYA
jgi:hypothetical protein